MTRLRSAPVVLALVFGAISTCDHSYAQEGRKRSSKVSIEYGFRNSCLRLIRPVWLLREKSVRDDLKLSEDQVKKLPSVRLAIYKKQGAWDHVPEGEDDVWPLAVGEMGEMIDKELRVVLSADQLKRLKQISLQVHESRYLGLYLVISHPDFAKRFDLTEKQSQTLAETGKELRDSELKMRNRPSDETAMKKHTEFVQANDRKISAMLTVEQKAKLKDLVGPEFKGKIDSLRR